MLATINKRTGKVLEENVREWLEPEKFNEEVWYAKKRSSCRYGTLPKYNQSMVRWYGTNQITKYVVRKL